MYTFPCRVWGLIYTLPRIYCLLWSRKFPCRVLSPNWSRPYKHCRWPKSTPRIQWACRTRSCRCRYRRLKIFPFLRRAWNFRKSAPGTRRRWATWRCPSRWVCRISILQCSTRLGKHSPSTFPTHAFCRHWTRLRRLLRWPIRKCRIR